MSGAGADHVLDVLGRYAPTWLAQMPPLLSAAERERLLARVAGTNRQRDAARDVRRDGGRFPRSVPSCSGSTTSIGAIRRRSTWISALALRAERAASLVLATYRPADVVVSGHPLGARGGLCSASGQAHELALGAFPSTDVQRYLALRFPASELPPGARRAVLELTDGNPLFLASLLDELVAERVLAAEDGSWRLRKRVEALGEVFPESLRHLIERQVERLSDEDQRILEAASASGREFSASAVAAALGLDADAVDGRFAGRGAHPCASSRRGVSTRLRTARRAAGIASSTRSISAVSTGGLSPAGKPACIAGSARQRSPPGATAATRSPPSWRLHFERGGDAPRAIRFLRSAAENAARRLAGTEAVAHSTRAIGLVGQLARREQPVEELRLQRSRSGCCSRPTKAMRRPRSSAPIGARPISAHGSRIAPELYPMLRGLQRFTLVRADLERAMTLARKGVAMARKGGEREDLVEAHLALGVTHFYAGELTSARAAPRAASACRGPSRRARSPPGCKIPPS